MKTLIKLEETGIFMLSVFLLYKLDIHLSWWLYVSLFFSPDIGMLGYLVNTRVGAFTYNIFHHKAVAAIVLVFGIARSDDYFLLTGLLLFAHSSFDRVLGYGLKYPDNFKHTNIGSL
jgi:hypothetical protein